MFVRAYLRASTTEQEVNRSVEQLEAFVAERRLTIASGTSKTRAAPNWADLSYSACWPPADLVMCCQWNKSTACPV